MNAMRVLKVLCVCAFAFTGAAHAQQPTGAPTVEIDDLRTPASPAFVVLDVTPAAVERPESAKAFVLNVLSTASQSQGWPQNYALQVAPYWLRSHPDLTFDQYQRPSPVESILRSLTLSVATSPLLDESPAAETVGSRLGLGVRTNVIGGQRNPALDAKLKALEDINEQLLDDPTDSDLRAEARQAALDIQHMPRVGLFVSAAGAVAWSVPEDDLDERRVDRWAVWVTPAYRFELCQLPNVVCRNVVDAMLVVRSLHDHDDDTRWDFGGRLLWEPNDAFNLSAEFVRRRGGELDRSSDRTVGLVEYRVRQDLLIFGSFGRDFEEESSRRTLVSIMGLSFGFGRKPTARLP